MPVFDVVCKIVYSVDNYLPGLFFLFKIKLRTLNNIFFINKIHWRCKVKTLKIFLVFFLFSIFFFGCSTPEKSAKDKKDTREEKLEYQILVATYGNNLEIREQELRDPRKVSMFTFNFLKATGLDLRFMSFCKDTILSIPFNQDNINSFRRRINFIRFNNEYFSSGLKNMMINAYKEEKPLVMKNIISYISSHPSDVGTLSHTKYLFFQSFKDGRYY